MDLTEVAHGARPLIEGQVDALAGLKMLGVHWIADGATPRTERPRSARYSPPWEMMAFVPNVGAVWAVLLVTRPPR